MSPGRSQMASGGLSRKSVNFVIRDQHHSAPLRLWCKGPAQGRVLCSASGEMGLCLLWDASSRRWHVCLSPVPHGK